MNEPTIYKFIMMSTSAGLVFGIKTYHNVFVHLWSFAISNVSVGFCWTFDNERKIKVLVVSSRRCNVLGASIYLCIHLHASRLVNWDYSSCCLMMHFHLALSTGFECLTIIEWCGSLHVLTYVWVCGSNRLVHSLKHKRTFYFLPIIS